jgi:hypothetical protein
MKVNDHVISLFLNFLEKEGVYFRYRSNLETLPNAFSSRELEALNGPSMCMLIQGAFIWDDTPEGHSFWLTINSKWIDEIENSSHPWIWDDSE